MTTRTTTTTRFDHVTLTPANDPAAQARVPSTSILALADLLAEVCVARLAAANLDRAARSLSLDGVQG